MVMAVSVVQCAARAGAGDRVALGRCSCSSCVGMKQDKFVFERREARALYGQDCFF